MKFELNQITKINSRKCRKILPSAVYNHLSSILKIKFKIDLFIFP